MNGTSINESIAPVARHARQPRRTRVPLRSITAVTLLLAACAAQAVVIDDLEDLSQGDIVATRTIDGVTVTIGNASGSPFRANLYDQDTVFSFGGDGGANVPLGGAGSGEVFISTAHDDSGSATAIPADFNDASLITFDFSSPVLSFGLTTIDVLQTTLANPQEGVVRMTALDASGNTVDFQELEGGQGDSGLGIDWFVSSVDPVITRVTFGATTFMRNAGYGIDDLALEAAPAPAPAPGTLLLLGGLPALAFAARFRRATRRRGIC